MTNIDRSFFSRENPQYLRAGRRAHKTSRDKLESKCQALTMAVVMLVCLLVLQWALYTNETNRLEQYESRFGSLETIQYNDALQAIPNQSEPQRSR